MGIMCAYSLSVLIERCIYQVSDKYIVPSEEKIWKEGIHAFQSRTLNLGLFSMQRCINTK